MPYEIRFEHDAGLVEVRVTGAFTGADFRQLSRDIRALPGNRDGLRHLYDFTDANVQAVGSGDLRAVSEREPQQAVAGYAIVAPGDLAFGLSKIFIGTARGREGIVNVFRTRAAAIDWLHDLDRGSTQRQRAD